MSSEDEEPLLPPEKVPPLIIFVPPYNCAPVPANACVSPLPDVARPPLPPVNIPLLTVKVVVSDTPSASPSRVLILINPLPPSANAVPFDKVIFPPLPPVNIPFKIVESDEVK